MGVSSGFKNNAYYESERTNVVVSHNEFARDAEFENLEKFDDLVDYLLSKDYDKYFHLCKNGQVTVDTMIINKLFFECYEKYKTKVDSVQIFHIVTDFYRIEPSHMFQKLVKKLRVLLIKDLKERINVTGLHVSKIDKNVIQRSFMVNIMNSDI